MTRRRPSRDARAYDGMAGRIVRSAERVPSGIGGRTTTAAAAGGWPEVAIARGARRSWPRRAVGAMAATAALGRGCCQ